MQQYFFKFHLPNSLFIATSKPHPASLQFYLLFYVYMFKVSAQDPTSDVQANKRRLFEAYKQYASDLLIKAVIFADLTQKANTHSIGMFISGVFHQKKKISMHVQMNLRQAACAAADDTRVRLCIIKRKHMSLLAHHLKSA